jgi:hypothetical protein
MSELVTPVIAQKSDLCSDFNKTMNSEAELAKD